MKCIIISNFIRGNEEKIDQCNKGNPNNNTYKIKYT